jgi:type VI secretion system secreted protein VgrG
MYNKESSMGASDPQFLFQINGKDYETRVVEFDAIEGISCSYEINLTLAVPIPDRIAFDEVAGLEALLTIKSGKPAPFNVKTRKQEDMNRYFHGIINKVKLAGRIGDFNIHRVQLVPSLWLLSLERDCRIFQNKPLEKIISTVLEERNIKGDRVRFALNRKDIKKEYCVQYRETDLNFISRLMEEEGIFYFFEHEKDKHTLVITDNVGHCFSIKGKAEVVFNTSDGLNADEESIAAFNFSQRIRPGAFTHTSFNYEHTSNDLKIEKQGNHFNRIEVYDYSGKHLSQEEGRILADVRLEEQKLLKMKGKGLSNCPRLTPGYTFTLSDSDSNLPEKEYLIVAVAHSGEQPQSLDEYGNGSCSYENGFIGLPAKTPFRPNRITPKPVITGLQTATVVGPKGEEICTDEYGRIVVHFHWDRLGERDDTSSCWIRVAQAWGGLTRGAQYIPRIGDEVLVDFLEGDPDRPIVTGSVYNSDNMPINSLKKSITQSGFKTKTHKGSGFHELRFDDAKGKEEIFLHSQKDWNVVVKNNEAKTVGNALVNRVGKTATVVAGEQLHLICGNASIVLDHSGKIVIHGTEVFVSSSGALHLDGKPIQLNMGGATGISAALMPAMQAVTGATGGNAAPAPSFALATKPPVFGNHASAKANPAGNTKKTGLGKDVDVIAVKSPSMQKNVDTFVVKNRGTIKYGPVGKGSYFDKQKNLIVIDGALKGKPEASAQVLSHELGHAVDSTVIDTTSRAGYIDSMLRGEGDAALANLEARKEILANGGPDIGVAGARSADYEKIYTKYGTTEKASKAIGKVFGDKEITSTTKEIYKDYYGKIFDAKYGKTK